MSTNKKQISIYANGQRIAREESGAIKYEAGNPATGSWVVINGHSDDRWAAREERDPFDADLPLTDPAPSVTFTGGSDGQLYYLGGDPFDLASGCELKGMPVSCSLTDAAQPQDLSMFSHMIDLAPDFADWLARSGIYDNPGQSH